MGFPKRIKIVYEREGCIGAAACAGINPEDFIMNSDGKADLTESYKEGKYFIKIVTVNDQKTLDKIIDSIRGCPVDVLEVWDMDENNKIAP